MSRGPVGRKKCRKDIVLGETHGSEVLTVQGARKGVREALTNLHGNEHQQWKQKKQGTEYGTQGTQVTQPGCQDNPLCSPSFPPCSFVPAAPFLLPSPLSQAWQAVSDGGLMGRAKCFLCFVQMYKRTVTYSHYPVTIHHTDSFCFPCTKYVTGTLFVTNGTIGSARLL